eukprot:IDg23353t1
MCYQRTFKIMHTNWLQTRDPRRGCCDSPSRNEAPLRTCWGSNLGALLTSSGDGILPVLKLIPKRSPCLIGTAHEMGASLFYESITQKRDCCSLRTLMHAAYTPDSNLDLTLYCKHHGRTITKSPPSPITRSLRDSVFRKHSDAHRPRLHYVTIMPVAPGPASPRRRERGDGRAALALALARPSVLALARPPIYPFAPTRGARGTVRIEQQHKRVTDGARRSDVRARTCVPPHAPCHALRTRYARAHTRMHHQ